MLTVIVEPFDVMTFLSRFVFTLQHVPLCSTPATPLSTSYPPLHSLGHASSPRQTHPYLPPPAHRRPDLLHWQTGWRPDHARTRWDKREPPARLDEHRRECRRRGELIAGPPPTVGQRHHAGSGRYDLWQVRVDWRDDVDAARRGRRCEGDLVAFPRRQRQRRFRGFRPHPR